MGTVNKLLGRLSYKAKLMLSYLAIVSLPVLLGVVYLYNTMVGQANQPLLTAVQQRMEQERAAVLQTVADIENSAQLLSTQTDINRFFTPSFYSDRELITAMNQSIMPTLSWFDAISNSVQRFRFLTQNAAIPEGEFFEQATRYEEEAWYQSALEGTALGGYFLEGAHPTRDYVYVENSHPYSYCWFYLLPSPGAENRTLLEATINANELFGDMNTQPVAESGVLLAYANGYLVEDGGLGGEAAAALLEQADAVFTQGDGYHETTLSLGEGEYYVSTLYVEQIGTHIASLIPLRDISAPARAAQGTFTAILAGIVALVLALSYVVAALLLKRIQRMLTAVKTIQRGDFSVRIPLYGEDEIDELAGEINVMADHIDTLINTVYKAEALQKESQFAALRAQINPHFLFNTLETLKMASELGDTERLSAGITALGGLMRYNLAAPNRPVPLSAELQNLRDYVRIQQLLLDDRVRLTIDVPEALQREAQIMAQTLQPLAENSVKHGFKKRIGVLELHVSAVPCEDGILLTLADNGTGITPARLAGLQAALEAPENPRPADAKGGIGLWNVNQRLVLALHEKSALRIRQGANGGVATDIFLPLAQGGIGEES